MTIPRHPKVRFKRRVGYFPRKDDPAVGGREVVANLVRDAEARHDNITDQNAAKVEVLTKLCGVLFDALLIADILTLQQAHDIAGYGHTTTAWDER